MKKTIAGIFLFAGQLGLAIFYNHTIDLVLIAFMVSLLMLYILYKYFRGKYGM
jgi:hypothetical protein